MTDEEVESKPCHEEASGPKYDVNDWSGHPNGTNAGAVEWSSVHHGARH